MPRTHRVCALLVLVLLAGAGCDGATPESVGNAAGDEATSAAADEAQVTIQGSAFDPAQVEIAAGGRVEWRNDDATTHTVTFADGEDSGSLAGGDTYERTFTEVGDHPYVCSIHPGMSGSVTVSG